MVILRTGYNPKKDVKTDYGFSKKKKIKTAEYEEQIIGYIKGATNGTKQIIWVESNKNGRVYIMANKKLFELGFYEGNYKTKDIKVLAKVSKSRLMTIKEIIKD